MRTEQQIISDWIDLANKENIKTKTGLLSFTVSPSKAIELIKVNNEWVFNREVIK